MEEDLTSGNTSYIANLQRGQPKGEAPGLGWQTSLEGFNSAGGQQTNEVYEGGETMDCDRRTKCKAIKGSFREFLFHSRSH